MADELHVLLGSTARKYIPSIFVSSGISTPTDAMSAYTLSPASGVYSTVVSVVGAGRLRGFVLSAPNNSSQNILSATIRLTVDSVVFSKTASVSPLSRIYFCLSEGVFYTGGVLVCTLLPAIEFDSNLKIEVMQVGASGSFTLYELHELEV